MSVSHVLRWVTVPFAGHQGRAGAVTGAVILVKIAPSPGYTQVALHWSPGAGGASYQS